MKIQASTVSLESDHYFKSEHQLEEQLEVSFNPRPAPSNATPSSMGGGAFNLTISRTAFEMYESHSSELSEVSMGNMAGSKLMQTKVLLEKLLGQKFELITFEEERAPVASGHKNADPRSVADTSGTGFGLVYERHETYREEEHTSFEARGSVQTADGKNIEFNLELSMDRQFQSESHVSLRMGEALIDPLVVNFSGRPAELMDETILFDLDADGDRESIHKLAPQSAYLVYDRNGDGIANNGSELFGPQTGSGFAELSSYDEDENGWIDENDTVFGQLSLWTQGEIDTYQTLAEAGVGAIFLDHVSTEMQLNDEFNETQGKIQETGVFLKEDGMVGTIQEIDLAVVA